LEELESPPDILLRDGARGVLRPRADGGGGFDRKGNNDSRFLLSLPTSIASGGAGDETAIRLPTGRLGLRGGGFGGLAPLLDTFDTFDEAAVRLGGLALLEATETEDAFRLGVSLPLLLIVLDRTLAVTLEANRFKGDMLLENALGVPLELPALLRFADPLARVEGVER
jgi:hypothetical protein